MRKLVLLFFVACLVYSATFPNQFVWDDEQFITQNQYVQHLSNWPIYFSTNTIAGAGQLSNYYRPLTTLSFGIDYATWGANPFGFHLTNLLLHALGGVLVYLALKKFLNVKQNNDPSDLLAYITAFAFVLHPAQVEAVAYMNSRGDSLSLVLGLLSLLFLIKTQEGKSDNQRIILGTLSVLAYIASLLAKESAIAWLGILILYALILHSRKHAPRPGVLLTLAIESFIALIYTVLRLTVLQFESLNQIWGPTNIYGHSLLLRLAIFFLQAVPEYLGILFWPANLHMERDNMVFTSVRQIPLSAICIALAFFLMMIAALIVLFRKRAKLSHPVYLGVLFLVILISPFSGVVPINGVVYEHWLYAPMIGFWLVVFYLLQRIFPKRVFFATTISLLIIWGVVSVHQITFWQSPFTLFSNILKYTESARIHLDLGMAYADNGQLQQAKVEYDKSLALADFPQTHHNLGNMFLAQGQYASAEAEFKKALAIDPTFGFSLNVLIQLEMQLGHKAEAQYWANDAVQRFPSNANFIQLQQRANAMP